MSIPELASHFILSAAALIAATGLGVKLLDTVRELGNTWHDVQAMKYGYLATEPCERAEAHEPA